MNIGPFAGWRAEVSSGSKISVGEKLLKGCLTTHEPRISWHVDYTALPQLPSLPHSWQSLQIYVEISWKLFIS